ncbi:MAG: hypothetical protein R3E44_14485 [Paracoccaceae bacterium]
MLSLEISPITNAFRHRAVATPRTFDFSTGILPPGLAVTRASAGTGFYTDGSIVSYAPDAARFSSEPANPGAGLGLVLEPHRSNLLVQSEGGVGAWSSSSATLGGLALGALGRFSGVSVASTGATWNRAIRNIALAGAMSHVLTAFVRAGSSGSILVMFKNATTGKSSQAAGPLGSLSASDDGAGAVAVLGDALLADGLTRRLVLRFTPAAGATHSIGIGPGSAVPGQSVIVLAVQLEAGSEATSYMPTTTAVATRLADAVTTDLAAGDYSVGIVAVGGATEALGVTTLAAGQWPVFATRLVSRIEFRRL